MVVTIPILNYGNFIGRIGESIVEKYLRENDFIILGKEYEIPYISARADFIVTKNKENAKKFKKRPKIDYINYVKNHLEYILAEFKGKDHINWSYEKLSEIKLKISEENPNAAILHIGNDDALIFYNILPAYEEEYLFIQDNYCLLEVKASLGKYPKGMGGRKYTKAQKVHQYYDVLLRVKIEKNFDNGFKGTIHPKDLQQLYYSHKILVE